MMVMAMMTDATSQPSAIQAPPIRIQNTLSRMETGCMAASRLKTEASNIGAAPTTAEVMPIAFRYAARASRPICRH